MKVGVADVPKLRVVVAGCGVVKLNPVDAKNTKLQLIYEIEHWNVGRKNNQEQ